MLNKLERKLNGNRWPSFMLICIILYGAGFIVSSLWPGFFELICFNPHWIFKGQIWRLFSFLMVPDNFGTAGFFLTLLTCFIYFSISRSLEMIIGRFKMNFFIFTGWLLTLLAGFLFYFFFRNRGNQLLFVLYLNPYYLYAMMFILFALIFPDATFLFMFIIPIKGKWMTFITLGLYTISIVQAFTGGAFGYGWLLVFMIVAALLNVALFLFLNGRVAFAKPSGRAQKTARYGEEPKMHAKSGGGARHKCAVCGRTELTNPELDFRYCSKCIGPYEYCNEHLYTHVHKRPENL